MTTASAATTPASFSLDSSWQQQPAVTGNTFAQEFEGFSASQEHRAPHVGNVPDRGPARHSSSAVKQPAVKQQKDNNVDQAAAVATPATAVTPLALPLDLHMDFQGTQEDAGPAADEANTAAQPAAAAGPQQPGTLEGPALAGDPQTTAFMMRMQVAVDDDAAALQQGLTDAGISGVKKPGEGDMPEPASLPQTQSALAAFEQGRQMESGGEIKQAAAPSQAPELRDVRADEPTSAPQPLNNILLQVNQSATEKVLVSLVQQSGELRLAVRTDDAQLAQGLQQGLADLVGKLQGNGYRADTWHPVQSSIAAGPALESQNASNQPRQGDSQSQPGWSQQDGGQQRQNQSNRPRWVEELESNLGSGGQTPGESYGFSS